MANTLNDYNGYRNNHGAIMKSASAYSNSPDLSTLHGRAPNNPSNRASLKAPIPAARNPDDVVASLKRDLAGAKTGKDKAKVLLSALGEAKNNPALTQKLVTTGLKETHGSDRAELMVAMITKEPLMANKLAEMDPKLTSLEGADLRGVGKGVALLPFNAMNVRGSTLPDNLDLRSNAYVNNYNFDGVIAPGIILPGHAHGSAQNAQMHQNTANAATAILQESGADTGAFQIVRPWDFVATRSGTQKLDHLVQATNTQKIGLDGSTVAEVPKAKGTTPKWAMLGISDTPAPPA
ncbi:MAG: hypothetical protein M3N08_05255 [Pseudomonadota bacterium]|nr:hypothetical protein [Pseudomonadota bacterium]